MDKFFSTTEVAKICQVTPGSVIRWIKEGQLDTALTVGGHRRIPAKSVAVLLKKMHFPIPPGFGETDQENAAPKILVVDDEPNIRQMVRWNIGEFLPEAKVEEAEDGFIAGWKAKGFRPDLVILDIMMPGMDGFKFCEFVKATFELKRTRIIAMSGVQGFGYETKILKEGANVFLAKPFTNEELKTTVLSQLEKR